VVIHETINETARKSSMTMTIVMLLLGAFGPLLTMHIYVRPARQSKSRLRGFLIPDLL
jgi:hypothetical protein